MWGSSLQATQAWVVCTAVPQSNIYKVASHSGAGGCTVLLQTTLC